MKKIFAKLKRKFNSLGRRKMLAVILIATVGLTAVGVGLGVTYAKYSRSHASDNSFSARKFYFESNVLKSGGVEYDIYNNSIKFDLMNYPDGQRRSEVDINYTVTISSSDGGSLGVGTNTSGTLSSSAANKTTVTYSGLTYGKTYTVTAESTLPYTKTISATFRIVEGDYEILYTLEDREDYVLMTLTTADYLGNVNITWQNGYVPDNSEPILASASGTSCVTTVMHNSHYTLKFFKSDSGVTYNEAAFSVAAVN